MSRLARVIVERLGENDAKLLASLVGGTRIHVPAELRNIANLKAMIGERLAIRVVLHFGGSRLYVPRMARRPAVDHRAVMRLTRRGWSASRIARKLGCSDRTVYAKRATYLTTNRKDRT